MRIMHSHRRLFMGSSAIALTILLIMVGACSTSSTTATATATVTVPATTVTVTTGPITLPTTLATISLTPTTALAITAAPTTGTVANGQRIFLTATSSSGLAIYGEGYMMYGEYVSCSNCHGQNGHGGPVYMMMLQLQAPNITWTALTDSKQYNPSYTNDTLNRAITQGIGSDGSTLSIYMPRWQMSAGDLTDLISFIHTLS